MTLDRVSTPNELLQVGQAANRLDAILTAHVNPAIPARAELRQAIVKAHQAGYSYRAIAQAAGISHQRVAQLVQKEEK